MKFRDFCALIKKSWNFTIINKKVMKFRDFSALIKKSWNITIINKKVMKFRLINRKAMKFAVINKKVMKFAVINKKVCCCTPAFYENDEKLGQIRISIWIPNIHDFTLKSTELSITRLFSEARGSSIH